MLKVFIITQNEPFFIPKMMRLIIENQGKDYQIVGFSVLSPSRKNKSILSWFKERAIIYSYFELFLVGVAFSYSNIAGKLGLTINYNNRYLFSKWGIKEIATNDINSLAYRSQIKSLAPDIILSISCPQLFGKELLSIPKKYCINAHGTLLPRHRGVFGSFWTLFDDDEEAGGTIHTMELKLDAGEILWQEAFKVSMNDTQYSIAYKTKKMMALGLVSLFKKMSISELISTIGPVYKSSYHRAPNKNQGKELKSKKKRIVIVSNLKLMLAKSFK